MALLGYRYAVTPNIYLGAKYNTLYQGFVSSSKPLHSARWIHGGALTLGISSLLGPIDVSLMYSSASKKIVPYFNSGFPFRYR